ncbi:MAG: hypothetical protein Kow00122_05560 [Thermoleophilia bacterium]
MVQQTFVPLEEGVEALHAELLLIPRYEALVFTIVGLRGGTRRRHRVRMVIPGADPTRAGLGVPIIASGHRRAT